jgi:peptidoglycan/LPS O-acetylase OafA/YrhL
MKQTYPSKPIQRFDTIDLLRGLSVLGVVYLHITILLPQYILHQTFPVWLQFQYGGLGGSGVPCFFAISGFLITLNAIRRFGSLAAVVPWSFYRIRFARIAPPLLLLLCILSVLHMARIVPFIIDPSVSTLPRALFAVFTFQFNHLEAIRGWFSPSWSLLWTLSVEEMFYLCFPLLCFVLLRRRWGRPVFLAVLFGFVVIGSFARRPSFTSNPMWAEHSYLSNMDNIALGCLFGLVAGHISSRFSLRSRLWSYFIQALGVGLIILACGPAFINHVLIFHLQLLMWTYWLSPDVLGLGICLVMLGNVLYPSFGSIFTAPLRWLGRYSYEIYLNHEFAVIGILLLYGKVRKGPISLWAVAIVLLSGLLGHLVSRYFSEPMNRLLRGAPLPSQLKSP